MSEIKFLEWDSSFFGYPIGKLEIKGPTGFDLTSFQNEASNYKLVYVFSKEEIFYENFVLVDKKVVYVQKNISSFDRKSSKNKIQSFNSRLHDLGQLLELTLESGRYSRFNLDPNFNSKEYSKLYSEWIKNSINGKLAFDILVCVEAEQIVGFTTIAKKSENLADIGLVAVHKNARGKGIATDLINKTIERAAKENFANIQVVTQANNIPATKLYSKTNFVLKEQTNIYHYWNL